MSEPNLKLVEFALGLLEPAEMEAMERQIESSPALRQELLHVEESLDVVARAQPAARPGEELRTRILASIEAPGRFEGFLARAARLFDLAEGRVREILASVEELPGGAWRPDRVPGTTLLHFAGGPRVAAADCGLVHIAPGITYPAHRHVGDEWSLILSGSAIEDSGRRLEPGALIHRPAGSSHSFRVVSEEPLLFAIVLHEGIEGVRD